MVMKITIMASYTFLIIENIKIKYSTKYVVLGETGDKYLNIIYIYLLKDFSYDIVSSPISTVIWCNTWIHTQETEYIKWHRWWKSHITLQYLLNYCKGHNANIQRILISEEEHCSPLGTHKHL